MHFTLRRLRGWCGLYTKAYTTWFPRPFRHRPLQHTSTTPTCIWICENLPLRVVSFSYSCSTLVWCICLHISFVLFVLLLLRVQLWGLTALTNFARILVCPFASALSLTRMLGALIRVQLELFCMCCNVGFRGCVVCYGNCLVELVSCYSRAGFSSWCCVAFRYNVILYCSAALCSFFWHDLSFSLRLSCHHFMAILLIMCCSVGCWHVANCCDFAGRCTILPGAGRHSYSLDMLSICVIGILHWHWNSSFCLAHVDIACATGPPWYLGVCDWCVIVVL